MGPENRSPRREKPLHDLLHDLLLERLARDLPPGATWDTLVRGALEGAAALESFLVDGEGPALEAPPPIVAAAPATAYLRSVTVEGFRGIGRATRLELPPGPGLVLVVGRNGSGKSSFAEGLELLLTGNTFRWAQRTKVWREGWRNLHHPEAALSAEFVLEGERAPATVTRRWAETAGLEAAETSVQVQGKARKSLDALGWAGPLVSYRPFLSYNELGSMLDEGPSRLYDALASILGLDDLVAAQERLAEARKAREKAFKEAADMRARILAALPAVDDDRARALLAALGREDWGLDDAETIVSQAEADEAGDRERAVLKQLAALSSSGEAEVEACARALTEAARMVEATAGTLASRSKDLADVLDQALRFHKSYGDGPCPVCGKKGALDPQWHEHQAAEVKRLRDAAREATSAQAAAETARRKTRELSVPRADVVRLAPTVGLDGAAVLARLEDWQVALTTADLEGMGAAVGEASLALRAAVTDLRSQAAAEVRRREDAWRPLALQIGGWLGLARAARDGALGVKPLKAAEAWLKGAIAGVRDERFRPIKEKCQAIWTRLRQQSNVSLEDVRLSGSATARKVELSVTVDGVLGSALGVMSQGELHALALSLFIPRATLPESPFRFIVIDDPVQSMDPSRVDGLARVFEAAAADRQVVVFTHDDRLPEAVRRLGIAAHVREVTRREGSVVEVRKGRDPVARNIEDAMAVARTEGLPVAAARRVIPGLCRLAVEAACTESVRRRRLGRGERHVDVEEAIARCSGTRAYVALALFDDPDRIGEVATRLKRESADAADVLRVLNEGAHGLEVGMAVELVRRSERLAQWLQGLK